MTEVDVGDGRQVTKVYYGMLGARQQQQCALVGGRLSSDRPSNFASDRSRIRRSVLDMRTGACPFPLVWSNIPASCDQSG